MLEDEQGPQTQQPDLKGKQSGYQNPGGTPFETMRTLKKSMTPKKEYRRKNKGSAQMEQIVEEGKSGCPNNAPGLPTSKKNPDQKGLKGKDGTIDFDISIKTKCAFEEQKNKEVKQGFPLASPQLPGNEGGEQKVNGNP